MSNQAFEGNKEKTGEKKDEKIEVRVIDALEEESRRAPLVPHQYGSLLGQTAAMLLAERWIDDESVGIEAIRRVYKQIYEADVTNQKLNVGLMRLKLDLASRNFDVFERLLASRMRMAQLRREPMRDISGQTQVITEVMNKNKPTGVTTEASIEEDIIRELETRFDTGEKKEGE